MYRKWTLKKNRVGTSQWYKWDKVFKNGPSRIYGRQPLGNIQIC